MVDVAKIAEGLTEAQRGVILGQVRYPKWATQLSLERIGIVEMVGGLLTLTPLGLAVREYLKERGA